MKKYSPNFCLRWSVALFISTLGVFSVGHATPSDPSAPSTTASGTTKSVSPDEVAVRNVADQLYAHVFKTPEEYPKMEPVKSLFVDKLYALILPESKRKVVTEDDVSGLQFIPGNGGAETYAVQSAEIQGSLATISVIFDGFDGRNGQDPHKMVLHLERQKSDRWLISDISEFYDGKLWSWSDKAKNLETVSASASAGAASDVPSDRLCGGKVLTNGGVIMRQSSNRKAKEICKIPTKSDLDILRMDGPEEQIEAITSKWFYVRWNSPQGKREGWVFGGFIQIPLQKDLSTTTPSADKRQWIGQNSDAVAKKLGLAKRESRDIDSDGTYGLELYGTNEEITSVFFGKSAGKTSDGYHIYKVLDIFFLPPLSKEQFFSHCGDLNGKRDDQLFGIGINDKAEDFFKNCARAWRANIQSGKIEEIASEGIKLAISTE